MNENTNRIFVKGIYQSVWDQSKYYLNEVGKQVEIDDQYIENINKCTQKAQKQSEKIIFVAYSDIDCKEVNLETQDIEELEKHIKNLTIIAFIFVRDTIQPQMPTLVQQLQNADINLKILTGDNKITSSNIASELGLIKSQDNHEQAILEGSKLNSIIDDSNQNISDYAKVLYRSTPENKLQFIKSIQQSNHIVAMVGNGSNDIPSLKQADIGFCMGISGTEIAKESSNIIILDDNIFRVITSILWSRKIVNKTLQYLEFEIILVFITAILIFISHVLFGKSPLSLGQIIFIFSYLSIVFATTLVIQQNDNNRQIRKPIKVNQTIEKLLNWDNIFTEIVKQIVILSSVLYLGPLILNIPTNINNQYWNLDNGAHFTILFNTFVYLQLFYLIHYGFVNSPQRFLNTSILPMLISIVIIQILVTQFSGGLLQCSPLTLSQHFACLSLGIISFLLSFILQKKSQKNKQKQE